MDNLIKLCTMEFYLTSAFRVDLKNSRANADCVELFARIVG